METYGPPNTPGWTVIGGRGEGDAVPDMPADIWQVDWQSTGERIRISDPIYGNQLTLDIAELETDGRTIRFAVREVSSGVYLFALPRVR